MKKGLVLLLVLIFAVTSAACGAKSEGNEEAASVSGAAESEEITVAHQLGETKVSKNPETVVVFDFGTLDTLDRLGVKVTAVPQANVPSYLEKYKGEEYKNAGGLMEPDFEAINEMDPDLIVISGRQADSYEEFSEIGPTILMSLDANNYMESFKSNVTLLGEIFGKQKEAEEQLAQVEASVQALRDEAAASGKNGLIILTTGGKISAYGSGSRFGVIHDEFGVKAADEDIVADAHGMSVSFEYIAEKNPDYLFVIDRDAVVSGSETSAQSVVENELVKNTNAYKNDNIVYLDPNYWYLSGGGLLSVAEMVKEIQEGLK